jgi:hypothetical protein
MTAGHKLMRLKSHYIRRNKEIHTFPIGNMPFRFLNSLNLAHIERKCFVSVTLPTKSRIQPITPWEERAGLQFLRPPHRLPTLGLRSRVSTESCKANASNRARPQHASDSSVGLRDKPIRARFASCCLESKELPCHRREWICFMWFRVRSPRALCAFQ